MTLLIKFSKLFPIMLFLIPPGLIAQRIDAQVKVEMPRLQQTYQQELSDLGQKLTGYITETRWSDTDQDIVLNCNLNIIVETVNFRGAEKVYLAQFLISSPSGENFYDQNFEFTYFPAQSFQPFRTSFDPLLDMVDFYVYMVLAGEMDTYDLFAGTSFYDRCQDLANRGQLSNYGTGWKNRLDEVVQITDGDHVPLREVKFYYYEGLYFVEKEVNPDYARKFAQAVVERLAKVYNKRPSSRALKRFFDSHYQEICKLFQFDANRTNITTMMDINGTHAETYRDCKTERRIER